MTALKPKKSAVAAGPLGFPVFPALWMATIVANVGTWMRDVGSGRLMILLSPSPLLVALVQTATTLPMFLLPLPAGALADIIDRCKMPLTAQLPGVPVSATMTPPSAGPMARVSRGR